MRFASRIFKKDATADFLDKNGQYWPIRASSTNWFRATFDEFKSKHFIPLTEIAIDKNFMTIDDDHWSFSLFKIPLETDFLTARKK